MAVLDESINHNKHELKQDLYELESKLLQKLDKQMDTAMENILPKVG